MEEISIKELLKKEVWLIDVDNYGEFLFIGNEEEAEEMRKHKANYEGSISRKKRIELSLGGIIINDDSGTTSLDNFCERYLKELKK
jgi:hypothetical protein